ncbi:MAG TPA: hypothetical protein VNT79_02310 [Phycisphaerae bacterium]|nr:hypothetical protein [Phycisphaerae bacterium]
MSAIPPNAIGSVLQSGPAQQVQSKDRDSENNLRADASRKLSGNGTADIIEIESTDTADTQVHPDTGGTGGQGRYDPAPDEQNDEPEAEQPVECLHRDAAGREHLDLSA